MSKLTIAFEIITLQNHKFTLECELKELRFIPQEAERLNTILRIVEDKINRLTKKWKEAA